MIGFAVDLLVEHVLAGQLDPAAGEGRVYRGGDDRPVDVNAQEVDVRPLTSRVVRYEIGGSVTFRHVVSLAVNVQHGDADEAVRLRDLIVLDLVLRSLAARPEILGATDPATGQEVEAIEVEVDYRPLGISDTSESAVLVFSLDVTVRG